METVGGKSWPVLYKKNIVEILRRQVECNEDVTSNRRHNGPGASCHPVNFKWFENAEASRYSR